MGGSDDLYSIVIFRNEKKTTYQGFPTDRVYTR
jgi:hypothetical protein